MDLYKLAEPFPPEKLKYRIGSTTGDKTKGMALAYIDARDVADRLTEVCGIEGWQSRFVEVAGLAVCEIGINVEVVGDEYTDLKTGETKHSIAYSWVWKAGGAGKTDVEGEKGMLSDAFKRAGVPWGIGRYLYDFPTKWLPIEQAGNSYKFTSASMAQLKGQKEPPSHQAQPAVEYPSKEMWAEYRKLQGQVTEEYKEEMEKWAKENKETAPVIQEAINLFETRLAQPGG